MGQAQSYSVVSKEKRSKQTKGKKKKGFFRALSPLTCIGMEEMTAHDDTESGKCLKEPLDN